MYFNINTSQKVFENRRRIDEIVRSVDPNQIHKFLLDGVKLLKEAFSGVDCEEYAIGSRGQRHMLLGLPQIFSATEGDLVVYYDSVRGAQHVGIWQGDGIVLSKWGRGGPVLEHLWDCVPSCYGESVHFRRMNKSI